MADFCWDLQGFQEAHELDPVSVTSSLRQDKEPKQAAKEGK